ncbi:hypothetical protein BGZ60DRAFT_398709 [Tricladium varicosporioides]|nr:hypothetical protein BGZ60DRAFT_398709 [Hymenoscyphus varicosporioides]
MASLPTQALLSLVLIISYAPLTLAFNPSEWIKNPNNGTTLTIKEEIQCYSLPYGGIGFASHVLTYYAVAMLSNQRSPLPPWKKNSWPKLDKFLASVGLIVTIVVSVVTIVRCHARWQFIVMAVWKLDLSIALGCLTYHAATLVELRPKIVRRSAYSALNSVEDLNEGSQTNNTGPKKKSGARILWWLLLYVPGVIAGLVGLLSLVSQEIKHNRQVLYITIAFGSVIFIAIVLMLIVALCIFRDLRDTSTKEEETGKKNGKKDVALFFGMSGFAIFAAGFSGMAVLGAFYSDWILGAFAENLKGVPSSDNAPLYWSYFIAKRLPGLSI